jgi:hypothetical protein
VSEYYRQRLYNRPLKPKFAVVTEYYAEEVRANEGPLQCNTDNISHKRNKNKPENQELPRIATIGDRKNS